MSVSNKLTKIIFASTATCLIAVNNTLAIDNSVKIGGLYDSQAIYYKNNGKVICTQPRIPPTIGNSERISMELGLPISVIASNSNFKVKTNNFYVQMKHSNDSHLKNNCPHPTLKILTDGTLYEELIQNPLMKETVFSPGKKDSVYGLNNHYDSIY
jgi:hypothetical protein